MSVVTLQIGQAGCQGGTALFQLLAQEAGPAEHGPAWNEAADRFFYVAEVGGKNRLTARTVLVDTEPKAVAAAYRDAASRGWHYSKAAAVARQPGSANNWAAGALCHAPVVSHQVLGMLRRQAERCDRLSGFLVMQSMAGGTGAGLGSAMVVAMRDEYPSANILNHCIWPYDSGEVVVQPYNCLLTLASLAQHSGAILLAHNDYLSATCQQLLGIQRPGFADLNALAAKSLASVLLPASLSRAPGLSLPAGSADSSGASRAGRGSGGRSRPPWDSGSGGSAATAHSTVQPQPAPAEWDGTFSSGSRWEDSPQGSPSRAGGSGAAGRSLDLLSDACGRLCAQPGYPLLTLRCGPNMPPGSLDFTPFSWPVVLARLKDLQLAGATVEPGAGLGAGAGVGSFGTSSSTGGSSSGGSGFGASSSCSAGRQQPAGGSRGTGTSVAGGRASSNKTLASLLVLRGDQAGSADVAAAFDDTSTLFSSAHWQASPLAVASSNKRLGKQQMLASLLSNDQTPVVPLARMLGRAQQLFDARAYVHQYERHGLGVPEFEDAFEQAAAVLERYRTL